MDPLSEIRMEYEVLRGLETECVELSGTLPTTDDPEYDRRSSQYLGKRLDRLARVREAFLNKYGKK